MEKIIVLLINIYHAFALCPNGFIRHEESCYHILRIRATWAESRMYCHAYGSNLVSIETREENSFLTHYLSSVDDQFHTKRFWIGANDIAETGTYVWEGTQVRLDSGFTDYYHGSPDNGGDDSEEHCMELTEEYNYQWNDNECDNKYYPICEKSGIETNLIIG